MPHALFLLSLSLLLALGGWQLNRGMEKVAVEKLLRANPNHYITLDRVPPDWNDIAYRHVQLHGAWHGNRHFLLANRYHDGQRGYEVLAPYQLTDGAMLLVNRGWVATDTVTAPPSNANPTGQLYLPQKGFTIGPAYPPDAPSPIVIQYVDTAQLAAALGTTLQPAVVALDAAHPDALVKIWGARAMSPARHFGYAVQWWALAVTLLVFGIIWQRKKMKR